MKKQPHTSGKGPAPVRLEELCKNLTTAQLVSRLKRKHSCIGSRTTTAINEALARIGLPEIPEEEIRDILGEALAVLKSPQCSRLSLPTQQQSAELSLERPEARNSRQRSLTRSPDGNKLQSKTTEQQQRGSSSHISSEYGEATSQLSRGPCDSPLRAADSAGSGQCEEEPSILPGRPQETAASDSEATDSEATDIGYALDDQARTGFNKESGKVVETPRKKRLCDTCASFFDEEEAAERPARECSSPAIVSQRAIRQYVHPRSSPGSQSLPMAGQATTSRNDVQDIPESTRMLVKPSQLDMSLPAKRPRVRFTGLEEEAIVYGVMKFGHGSWKEIRDEGIFNGRHTRELSDKYRNMDKYKHLAGVRQRVKAKLAAGVNPLKELRAIFRQEQRRIENKEADVVSLTSNDDDGSAALNNVSDEEPGRPQEAANLSPQPASISTLVSSYDDDFAPAMGEARSKEWTRAQRASSSRAEVMSTSVRLPSHDEAWSSGSETDASGEVSARGKTKEKQKRVPFTPLETEALVSGFIKYGKGNWARIIAEGCFIGRTSIQLSDKFRNLRQYRHLPAVMETVQEKLARGEDPLQELRKVSSSHWKR